MSKKKAGVGDVTAAVVRIAASMDEEHGIKDAIAAIERIGDSLDRLVQIVEDLADAMEIPVSDRRLEVVEIREEAEE